MDREDAKKLVPQYISEQYEKISSILEEVHRLVEEVEASLLTTRDLDENLRLTALLIEKATELQGRLGSLKMVRDAYPSQPPPPLKDPKISGVQPAVGVVKIARIRKIRDAG